VNRIAGGDPKEFDGRLFLKLGEGELPPRPEVHFFDDQYSGAREFFRASSYEICLGLGIEQIENVDDHQPIPWARGELIRTQDLEAHIGAHAGCHLPGDPRNFHLSGIDIDSENPTARRRDRHVGREKPVTTPDLQDLTLRRNESLKPRERTCRPPKPKVEAVENAHACIKVQNGGIALRARGVYCDPAFVKAAYETSSNPLEAMASRTSGPVRHSSSSAHL